MSQSHRFTITHTDEGGVAVSRTITRTYDGVQKRSDVVNDAAADQSCPVSWTAADIKGLWILSDRQLLIETNDGTTPAETLNLEANIPYVWFEDAPWALHFALDVTALFLTNASGQQANVQIKILTA